MKPPKEYVKTIEEAASFINEWIFSKGLMMETPQFGWDDEEVYIGEWTDRSIALFGVNQSARQLLRDLATKFPLITIAMTRAALEFAQHRHHHLAQSKCPKCHTPLNCVGGIEHEQQPKPGDLSVCFRCAALLQFAENMELKLLNKLPDDADEDTRRTIENAQANVRTNRARQCN